MKNYSKKALSVLLAIILAIPMVMFTPLSDYFTAEASVTKTTSSPTVYFYVPETIYLAPVVSSSVGSLSTFQFYLDRANAVNGGINAVSTTGNVYFNCSDTNARITSIKVSGATVNGKSAGTTIFSSTSSNTVAGTISSGNLTSGIPENTTTTLTWTATYTLAGKTFEVKAYTVVFAPLQTPVFASSRAKNHRGVETDVQSIGWIAGLHGYDNGNSKIVLNTLNPLFGEAAVPGNTQNDGGYSSRDYSAATAGSGDYTNNGSDGTGETNRQAQSVSPMGYLTVDTSRVTNLAQIPDFSMGYMITYSNEGSSSTSGRDFYYYFHDYSGVYTNSNTCFANANADSFDSNKGTAIPGIASYANSSCGSGRYESRPRLIYSGAWDKAISSLGSIVAVKGSAKSWIKKKSNSRTCNAISTAIVRFTLTKVDKSYLRSQYNNALSSIGNRSWYTSASLSTYDNYMKQIAEALGNVKVSSFTGTLATAAGSNTSIGNQTAVNNVINAAKNSLVKKTSTATVNHKSSTGKVLKTETLAYTYGDTVTAGANSYTGYGAGVLSSTTAKSGTLVEKYADSDNLTWNFTYTPITYTATFVANDGSGADGSRQFTIEDSFVLPTIPQKTGYTFNGWKITSADSGTSWTMNNTYPNAQGFSNVYGNVTFTAQIKTHTYTVTYHGNGNTGGSTATSNHIYDQAKNLTANGFTKTGYTFEKWNTAADGTGTASYNNSHSVLNLTSTDGANIDLYAIWTANNYTVSFDANGGSCGTESKTVTYDSIYGDLPPVTRLGYTFTGWYNAQSGGTEIKADTIYKVAGNQTLYAHWIPNSYLVNIDLQNGQINDFFNDNYFAVPKTFGGTLTVKKEDTDTINVKGTLASTTSISRTGVNFSSDGSLNINVTLNSGSLNCSKAGESCYLVIDFLDEHLNRVNETLKCDFVGLSSSNPTISKNISFTPEQASAIKYIDYSIYVPSGATLTQSDCTMTINVVKSTGAFTSGVTTNVLYDSANTFAPVPTRTGYLFNGYFTAPQGNGDQWFDATGKAIAAWNPPADGTRLYASWTPIKFTVNYDINYEGGVNPASQVDIEFDANTEIAPSNPIRTGYDFNGWFYNNSLIGFKGDDITNLLTEDGSQADFVAKWTAHTYTVKYDANLGTGSVADQIASYGVQYDVASAESISRTGYTFVGWYRDSVGITAVGSSFKNLTPENNAVITFYAKWVPNKFTVKYSDGDNIQYQNDINYDSDAKITIDNPVKTGYAFIGWYDGDTFVGSKGTSIKNYTSVDGAVVELTARWRINTYNVYFNMNGGSGSIPSNVATYGETYNVPEVPANAKKGYIFAGWYMEAEGINPVGATYSNLRSENNAQVTLYAKWTPITYYVTYEANGGTGSLPATVTVAYDQTFTVADGTITKYGSVFAGWECSTDGATYSGGMTPKNLTDVDGATVTLSARWVDAPYDVFYIANNGTADKIVAAESANTDFNVIKNTFVYPGYTFAGWKCSADDRIYTYDGEKFHYPYEPVSGTSISFTAQWNPVSYMIQFSSNGGNISETSKLYTIEGAAALPVATKEGCSFDCWKVTVAGGNWTIGETFTGTELPSGKYGDVTLEAQWTENSYSVKYSNGDGYVVDGDTYLYSETFTLEGADIFDGTAGAKTGKKFTRWSYVDSMGTTKFLSVDAVNISKLTGVDNGVVILTADWHNIEYNVRFEAPDGVVEGLSTQKYNIESGIQFITATRNGYKFAGWVVKTASGSWVDLTTVYSAGSTSATGNYGDVTFTAKWTEISYDIVYKPGEYGTGAEIRETYTYEELVTLKDNTFVSEEKDFAGWKGSNGLVYSVGDIVQKLVAVDGQEFTLTAIWRDHDYISQVITHVTCTQDGEAIYTCQYCGRSKNVILYSQGHQYDDIVVEPTCLSEGYTIHKCIICGDGGEIDRKPVTDHHFEEDHIVTKPSCLVSAQTLFKCKDCGLEEVRVVGQAEHDFGEWVEVTPASCADEGIFTCTCQKCGNKKTKYTDRTDHNITEWATDGDGNRIGFCDVCQQTIIFSQGSTEGQVEGTCKDCGRVHKNIFSSLICFITQVFNFFKSLFK